MDPYNSADRDRLFRAMEHSFKQLEPFRHLVRGLVEEYAGSGYGSAYLRPRYEILVNLLNQAVDAYTMALVANRPRVLVTAKSSQHRAFANKYQVALNNLIAEIRLEQTLQRAVLDAFFCMGVVKMHMADSVPVTIEQQKLMDPGIPFASNVSIDNYVCDMSASVPDMMKFASDRYRIPFHSLKDPLLFDQDVVKDLTPSSKIADESERLKTLAAGWEGDIDELEPMIDVCDTWIPEKQKIYTFALDSASFFRGKLPPLAVMDWEGDECGPYPTLSFNDVPENIVPTGPASHLAGLSRLSNSILRKQARRARSQKKVHAYSATGEPDAKRMQKAADDEWVQVNDPKEIADVEVGGVDPKSQAFFTGLVQLYDRMAGNLTTILGLGAQADTLGQEQLINNSASRKIAQMQYRVADFSNRIVRELGRMLWNDAAMTIPGEMPIEGASLLSPIDVTWTPDEREGTLADYNLDIDVYSMPYKSPMQRLQTIQGLLTNVFMPMAPVMAQQGGSIDMRKLTEICAELVDEPRLKEVVQFTGVPTTGGDDEDGAGVPAVSHREYTRRSVPTGGSPQNQAMQEQQQWMSMAE